MIDHALTASHQRALNAWTGSHAFWLGPLKVDGISGPATQRRISEVKWYIGLPGHRNSEWTPDFNWLVYHFDQTHPGIIGGRGLARGRVRRADGLRRWYQNNLVAWGKPGVTTWEHKPVAAAAVPYLSFARLDGWEGHLYSGYRTPAYSEHLCYIICGAPSCPGRCAGRATNHAYAEADRFAIDVSDYVKFNTSMQKMPLHPGQPRLWNDLPSDRPHFSPSGH